jgi:hypothetical protein
MRAPPSARQCAGNARSTSQAHPQSATEPSLDWLLPSGTRTLRDGKPEPAMVELRGSWNSLTAQSSVEERTCPPSSHCSNELT